MTGLNNLQYATDNLFRRVHVVHCADANHNNLYLTVKLHQIIYAINSQCAPQTHTVHKKTTLKNFSDQRALRLIDICNQPCHHYCVSISSIKLAVIGLSWRTNTVIWSLLLVHETICHCISLSAFRTCQTRPTFSYFPYLIELLYCHFHHFNHFMLMFRTPQGKRCHVTVNGLDLYAVHVEILYLRNILIY